MRGVCSDLLPGIRARARAAVVACAVAAIAALALGAAGCSMCGTPLACAGDENCPHAQRCVAGTCAPGAAPRDGEGDASEGDAAEGDASEGDAGEGDASEGDGSEGDAGEGDGEGDAAEGDASEGDAAEGDGAEGDAGEGDGEGEPVDAGPCVAPGPWCGEAFCADPHGDGVYPIGADGGVAYCVNRFGAVWTLLAKIDGDDRDLRYGGAWDAVRNDALGFYNERAGQNAILPPFFDLAAQELMVGFVPLDAGPAAAPPTYARAPLATASTFNDVVHGAAAPTRIDELTYAQWRVALGAAGPFEALPRAAPIDPCVVGGFDGALSVRFGVADDCDAPSALIGVGAAGCPLPAGLDVNDRVFAAGSCEIVDGGPAVTLRTGVVFGR